MAAHHASLDPRTPVIVGVGQVNQRTDVLADALEPVALLAEAARAAGADSGSDRLLADLDTIATVNTLSWNYADGAALVAQQIGADPARTWATHDGGNYPQYLLNRVAGEIQAGLADAVLIGGVECMRTASAAHGQGAELGWTVQVEGTSPTHTFTNPEELWHRVEWKRHIIMPVSFYALYENALRAESGRTPAEHLAHLAQLWARFSDVAAGNPNAWLQDPVTADEIGTVSPGNRMIELPYTKFLNANMMVDQAACFIVCSVEKARALGIPTDRWVFPWVGTEAHEHWFVSTRMSLTDTPAVRVAGRAALELAGVGVDDIAHLDLYSCFPSAVQIAARELAIDLDRQLTVTGGLAFAGGPMNNYVSHSIAAMTDRLRADAGSLGLVWANGGFLTKHAFGVYGTEPPPAGFQHRDLQSEVDALPQREVVDEPVPEAAIETSTVSYHRDGRPNRGVAFALLPDGRRAIGLTLDPEVMDELATVETAGRAAAVDADGTLRLI